MAIKIKKTIPRPEEPTTDAIEGELVDDGDNGGSPMPPIPSALADDKVLLATRDTFDWVNDHRYTLLGAVAAIVLGMLVFSTMKTRGDVSRAEEALQLFRALDTVDTASTTGAAVREANEALRLAAGELAAANEGQPLGRRARMLEGRALTSLGDGAGALAAYQASAVDATGPENAVARFGVATAQAHAGNLAEALTILDAIAENEAGMRTAALHQKAVLIDTFGSPEQALEAWRLVASAQAPTASNPFSGGSAANRVRALELQLNVQPAAAAEEATL